MENDPPASKANFIQRENTYSCNIHYNLNKDTLSVVPIAQTFGDVCETKPYDIYDILRLVTIIVEEDQINTPTCSP